MKILVTGASGFIGREITRRLCKKGFEVHAVARKSIEIRDAIWHNVDLLDDAAVEKLLSDIKPSHLLHLAWCTEPGKFWNSADNLEWDKATRVLFDSFVLHHGERFVGAGTCAEYEWNESPCRESNLDGAPATLYGRTKLSTWNYIRAMSDLHGTSSSWGRIFWLYGPHEHPARLIPHVINGLLRGHDVDCTSGDQIRDFMHVFDVAEAFVRLVECEVAGAVNIASGQPIAVRSIIQAVADRMDAAPLIRFGALSTNGAEPHAVTADVEVLNSKVGFVPSIALDTGLSDTVSWWQINGAAAASK
ncbi:NAD(P)-dependent oxidoreductase [soil metagenome]